MADSSETSTVANSETEPDPSDPPMWTAHGFKEPWIVTPVGLDALRKYDVREDDVWIISHPKSGRNIKTVEKTTDRLTAKLKHGAGRSVPLHACSDFTTMARIVEGEKYGYGAYHSSSVIGSYE